MDTKYFPKTSGIYKINNVSDNKCYIGSSVNLRRRIKRHLYELNNGIHNNQHLQRAWSKYGATAFEVVILCSVLENNFLREIEKNFITEYKSCDPLLGYNKSEETAYPTKTPEGKQSFREKMKGRKIPKDSNRVQSMIGKRNHFYGKQHSRAIMLKMLKSRGVEPFVCVETGEVFQIIQEAADKLSISQSSICQCLKKNYKRAERYHFIWLSDAPSDKVINNFIEISDKQKSEIFTKIGGRCFPFMCLETSDIFYTSTETGEKLGFNRHYATQCMNGKIKNSKYHFAKM